jgi:hypothetical protein
VPELTDPLPLAALTVLPLAIGDTIFVLPLPYKSSLSCSVKWLPNELFVPAGSMLDDSIVRTVLPSGPIILGTTAGGWTLSGSRPAYTTFKGLMRVYMGGAPIGGHIGEVWGDIKLGLTGEGWSSVVGDSPPQTGLTSGDSISDGR